MSEVVTRLGGLRAVPDFAHDDLLVRTVGEAVRVLGPDVVLASLPVDLMAEESEETNAWLMPVLKVRIWFPFDCVGLFGCCFYFADSTMGSLRSSSPPPLLCFISCV